MTIIICVRLFEHARSCVCLQHGALVPRDHTQIQEKRGWWRRRKRRNNSFFKAAHYPAVSGCMAPSQNIMMRINLPGTTSFCWRPSQGSASAPPQTLSLFFSFPLFSLHHWHIGVCAMSSDDGELGSSGCISPIIKAAAFSSLTPFPLSLFTPPSFSLCALVKISSVPRSIFLYSLLLLYSSLSPHHLHAPSFPLSTPPPAATARPRLWFKHDGHPFEAWGHHHHHHRAHQQQAAPWTNLANTEREMHWRPHPSTHPNPGAPTSQSQR